MLGRSLLFIVVACTASTSGFRQVVGEGVPPDVDPTVLSVEEGCHDAPSDDITIAGAEWTGDTLLLFARHAGGCAEHAYRLCPDPVILFSYPGIQFLYLVHDANGDLCDSEIEVVFEVDVTTLPRRMVALYGAGLNSVTIAVD